MSRPRRNILEVVPLCSPGGRMSYCVQGHILGLRVRRRFANQAEADTFVADELAKVAPLEQVGHPLLTRLSLEQLTDAEAARAILPSHASLSEAAQFYLAHFKPVAPRVAKDALADYVASKSGEAKNRAYTVDILEAVLAAFLRDASISSTIDITVEAARGWIFNPSVSARTQRDRYDHLARFCKWLVAQKALLRTPIAELPRPQVEYGPPTILALEQIQAILDAAWTDPSGPEMLPFFAICLLSGARPFEVRRAKEEHFFIDADHGEPIFEVWESKTPWRTVDLQEPLLGILRGCKARGLNLAFFSKRRFDRVRRDAGVFDAWTNDIQRHTYASYHYALHRDVKWLEKSLGTSERVLFRHYIRRTVRKSDAIAFSRIAVDWDLPRRVAIQVQG